LNVIQIVSDTFRRDFLGCYGNNWIHTEHIDELAKDSLVFDKAYIASFPTIPHRHDLFTGRYTFTYSVWAPLPRDEIILSHLLRQAGYTTMLIADTYHMIKDGFYYDRGFDGWWWIRGQEFDRYMTHPTKEPLERKKILTDQYLRNVSMRRFESDYFVAQTMTAAEKWLELNYDQHKNFFLHIDTFDPHEPWDPPRWYAEMYDPKWKGSIVPGVAYGPNRPVAASELTEDELNHLRALYAGEVTLVDRWVGKLLQKIEDLGLYEDTAVIFTSDHGTYLGEHNWIGKTPILYEEVAHIPLIIRMPDSKGKIQKRFQDLVQPPDLMPTILELAGVQAPNTIQGKSLLPLIQGEEKWEREIALSAWCRSPHPLTITSNEWSLLTFREPSPVYEKNIGILLKQMGINFENFPELYHLPTDSKQTLNLYKEKREIAEELFSKAQNLINERLRHEKC